MPKFGIHHIVFNDAVEKLLVSQNQNGSSAANDILSNNAMAMLGSVGPDLFFFAPDYEIVDKLYTLYKNIEEIVDLYNDIVQPFRDIRDAVVEPVEDLVESLTPSTIDLIRQTIEEMKQTASLFGSTISIGLFSGVITGINSFTDLVNLPSLSATFFDMFKPPLQNNRPETEWYWFDMLHYRQTGQFGRALVANSNNATQRAYAYGYLSHIATDLVGHAYVNQIVGGPFRLHPQRHVVVENFMDCWKFNEYYGESINQTLVDKLGLPPELPSDIGDLLDISFRNVYNQEVPHPQRLPNGWLTRAQIDETYAIFYDVLQIMKKMYVPRPEEPFSGVGDILEDALKDLLEAPPSPPSSSSSMCSLEDIFSFGLTASSRDCYEEFVAQIENWLEYIVELLEWTLETLLDMFDLLLSLLLSLPIVVLLAILYGIQLLLYELYQSMRNVLAIEGFVFPEPDYLNSSHGRNLTTPFQCATSPFKYPKWSSLNVSHLVCPSSGLELPTTAAGYHPATNQITPNVFIKDLPFAIESLIAYAKASSPEETRSIEKNNLEIGNATDLTAWMIMGAEDPIGIVGGRVVFTNWNLDADRGYGYKVWGGTVPSNIDQEVDGEQYL